MKKRNYDVVWALSQKTRLDLTRILDDKGRKRWISAGALLNRVNCEPSLLSHHLKKLKDAGILMSERRGKKVYYKRTDLKIKLSINGESVI